MSPRTQINIRLSVYEKKKLEEVAAENNQTVADLLRQALNDIIADFRDGSPILKLRKN